MRGMSGMRRSHQLCVRNKRRIDCWSPRLGLGDYCVRNAPFRHSTVLLISYVFIDTLFAKNSGASKHTQTHTTHTHQPTLYTHHNAYIPTTIINCSTLLLYNCAYYISICTFAILFGFWKKTYEHFSFHSTTLYMQCHFMCFECLYFKNTSVVASNAKVVIF